MPRMIGPGDLYLDAMAADERAYARWLAAAPSHELIEAGICPECRDPGGPAAVRCQHCEDGRVLGCEGCGAAIKPGSEQVIPSRIDEPNGPTDVLCGKCAEAG